MWNSPRNCERALAAFMILVIASFFGCATTPPVQTSFRYFDQPQSDDAWTPKIAGWQSRERAMPDVETLGAPGAVSEAGTAVDGHAAQENSADLRKKYFQYRASQKEAMARELAQWVQQEARQHYVADGPIDHWATLEETLAGNGDDCDGLELLVYHFLRDLGFAEDEVYRAILYRPEDGQHHMVTLWFQNPDDPWVIDPTGAMTTGMPRISEVPGWIPLKVFSEDEEFTVRPVMTAQPASIR